MLQCPSCSYSNKQSPMARRESVRAFLLFVGLFALVALFKTVSGILDYIEGR